MLIKKTLKMIKEVFYSLHGQKAPRCQAVIQKQGNIDWLQENLYTVDAGWHPDPFGEPLAKLLGFGKLWLAQNARDMASCTGETGGTLNLVRLRSSCKAFASVAQIDAPTVLEPQKNPKGKSGEDGGLWGDDRHNFVRSDTQERFGLHQILWSHYDETGQPIPGKSRPIGTRIIAKKCSKVLPESWEAMRDAKGLCYAQVTPATTNRGKEIQKILGKHVCYESCDDGVKASCVAQLDWYYHLCTTCCCKGGVGIKSKVDVALIYKEEGGNANCGKWFQIMDLLFNLIANAATRGDALMHWSSRCIKF